MPGRVIQRGEIWIADLNLAQMAQIEAALGRILGLRLVSP